MTADGSAKDIRISRGKVLTLAVAALPARPVRPAIVQQGPTGLRECQGASSPSGNRIGFRGILFVVLGATVTEEFRLQQAATLRAMAEKADPFIKKRLLDLADRYERAPRPRPLVPIQSISAELAE